MRYAVIDNSTKIVLNCIEWNGNAWTPPNNTFVIPSDLANIGDKYDENKKLFFNVVVYQQE